MFNEKSIISQWIADMYELNEVDTIDVDFALSVIGTSPKRILEVACGSGRILIPMAKAGHIVTGLDFDEYILNKMNPKAVGLDNITWRKADVVNEDWGGGFDVVLLAGNILFNIISDLDYSKAQQLLIQKAADALVKGGSIYIDYGYTTHPENWFDNPNEHLIWEGTDNSGSTGRMILLNSTFDKESGMNKFIRRFELVLSDGSTVIEDIHSQKHFATLDQIHSWLSCAGFVVEEEYGDYNRNPISDNTSNAIIFAKKMC